MAAQTTGARSQVSVVSLAEDSGKTASAPLIAEGDWSNYTGVDDGSGTGKHSVAGDGIGDTDIPWPSANYDFYPFVNMVLFSPLNISYSTSTIDVIAKNTSHVDTVWWRYANNLGIWSDNLTLSWNSLFKQWMAISPILTDSAYHIQGGLEDSR